MKFWSFSIKQSFTASYALLSKPFKKKKKKERKNNAESVHDISTCIIDARFEQVYPTGKSRPLE
jgi:hypothetical protein